MSSGSGKHQITGHVPQVIVTLAPDGTLVAELPGFQATRRQVPLKRDVEKSLRRILQDQLDEHYEIGSDGAPTQQQVRHWERHGQWPDSRCRFCLAEGRASAPTTKRQKRAHLIAKTGEVEIRRLAAVSVAKRRKAPEPVFIAKSLEELDL